MEDIAIKPPELADITPLQHEDDYVEPEKPDILKLEYPALGRQIDEARQRGRNDSYIRKELARRESEAALYYPQAEINNYLGRTKQTNDQLFDAVKDEKYQPYIDIMRHKLQKEKVIDIVNTANYSGFAPSFLLANHDNKQLMEAAENAAGEHKNAVVRFLMSFSNGFSNWIRGKSERNRFLAAGARIGAKKATTADITDLMADPTSIYLTPEQVRKTNTDRLEDYAALSDWLAGWQESAASATYSHLRPVENAVGKIITEAIENGGFTLESGVVSTLAYAFGGPLGGLAARFYNTSAESETEAWHVYMEAFRRGLEHGLSPDQAEQAAYETAVRTRNKNLILLSATNSVGDFLLYDAFGFFKNFAQTVIPGGGWLSKIARGALRFGLPAVLDAAPEGFEEYMQEWIQMYDLGDPIDERQLLEAFKMGFFDSMLYAATGGAIRGAANFTPGARRTARIQSIIDNTVRDIYKLEEQMSNGEINADSIVEQDPIVFLPKSRIDEETAKALGLQGEVMEDEEGNVVETNPPVPDGASEEAEALEADERDERNDDEEAAVLKSRWDAFAAENPQKAQELADVLREGVQGVTLREQIARKFDTLRQAFTENSELVQEVNRVEQEALQAGRDAEQAKELSTIAGVVANSMNKQYGTDVRTGVNLAFRSVTGRNQQGSQAESYGQDARITPITRHDGVTDYETLIARNAEAETEFHSLMKQLQSELGGRLSERTLMKSEARIREKVEADYDGDFSRVVDVWGGSLIFDNEQDLLNALDKLQKRSDLVRLKNKWTNPDDTGYRDINANLRLSNGVVVELQLHHKGIMAVKKSVGHGLYKFIRKNERTDEMVPYVNQANEISRILYNAGIDGSYQTIDARAKASLSDIVRRLSNQTSARDSETLLNDLSALIRNTFAPFSSESIAPDGRNSTANGTSSPFSKYLNTDNTSNVDIDSVAHNATTDNLETYKQANESSNEDNQINARISWPFGTTAAESQSIVEFFSTANKSSGFHELWHHVFRVLTDAAELSDASDLLKHDVGVILRNAGVSREDFYGNVGNARTKAQEFFAKSGEAYLREGTAPTPELVSTFERIKDWLVEIYKNIKESLGIELNDEMRDIFDRLLATPEQLAEQKSAEEIDTLYEATQEKLEYTQAEIERIEAELAEAEARETMANEMRDYVFEPIPQEVIDAVNDWITASEHEGEVEEQYAADLNSRKKSVRETARERIINITRNVPLIEVNTNTLNALIAQGGIETAKQYLNERRAYLEKLQKSLEASLPAKNAGIVYQRGEIERLEKRRTSLQGKVKRLQKNPQANAFAIRTMQNEIEDITARLKDLRDESKNPQSEYNAVKEDISNILNEQREIADSLSALERVENADENTPVDYTESEVSDEDLITLAEALQMGYELAERYGLAGFEEGRNFQSEIDTEQTEQRLSDLNSEHNREIRDIERQFEKKLDDEILLATMRAKEIHDKDLAKLKAVKEQAKAKLKQRLEKLKQNQKLLRERQNERNRIRDKIKKLRNAINRMAKSQSVLWARQQEIKNLLDTYDFTKNGNLSLRDYEFIHGQVKELYETGKRELAAKKLITQERVNKMRQEIMATMQKDWDNRPRGALRHAGETSKEYNGLRGKVSKLIDWTMANTMSAQRFFDFLDGGQKYQGAWSKYFSDEANKAYDEELRHKFARALDLEVFMREQGITAKKLAEVRNVKVPHQGNKGWTVDELLSVYAGMKNERSRMAILYGNFADAETIEQAEAWAADCVNALTEQEKALADFIIQEYEKHFDRINDAIIDIYNQGMEHEENYTPMRRIEYTSKRDGVLDPDAAENLMSSQQGSGFRSVERGFTKSRQDISAQNQKGIELGLVSMWYSQVETQEHAAAFGQLVSDLRKILMARPKDGQTTVRQMVKETRGLPAWTMIRQYFNLLATSDTLNAYDALDGIAKTMAKNMSVAYLCGNLGTVLKQLGSFPRVLPYAGMTATLNAIAQFMRNPEAFIEECYRLDPQLKNRKGDPLISELRKGAGTWYDTLLAAGNYLIGAFDRGTSAVVFKAVYDANIRKGLSHDDAVRQAQRAVLLTQPVAHVKDKPLVWQQHGMARLAMMFTNDMAQTFGETVYDLVQGIRHGEVKETMYRLTGLTLAAMMIKLISGGLPDEPDDPEEWGKWVMSAFAENELASVPVIGKGLVTLWDYKRSMFGSQDPFIAPFAKLTQGAGGLWDDKNDNDERAVFNLIEGAALLSPLPATGLKRLWLTGKELGHGELLRAIKRAVGMRVEDKKRKRAVSF